MKLLNCNCLSSNLPDILTVYNATSAKRDMLIWNQKLSRIKLPCCIIFLGHPVSLNRILSYFYMERKCKLFFSKCVIWNRTAHSWCCFEKIVISSADFKIFVMDCNFNCEQQHFVHLTILLFNTNTNIYANILWLIVWMVILI